MRRETLSAIRYGIGLGPDSEHATSPDELLSNVGKTAKTLLRLPFTARRERFQTYRQSREQGDARKVARLNLARMAFDDVRHHLSLAVTDPGLAAQIRWATAFAERIGPNQVPHLFLKTAFADAASPVLKFAVGGSENQIEGIALTLVSPNSTAVEEVAHAIQTHFPDGQPGSRMLCRRKYACHPGHICCGSRRQPAGGHHPARCDG